MIAINMHAPLVGAVEKPSHAVWLLQVFSVTLMVFPGYYTVREVGADGYAAALLSYLMLMLWVAGNLLGRHNSLDYRYKVRITLAWMWIISLASYLLMNRTLLTSVQLTAADRWLMQLAGMSGIVLVTAEGLHTLEDVRRVLRVLVWAGAFCGIVAILQFKVGINLAKYLKLPGFSVNSVTSVTAAIVKRGAQHRVPGTASDPIELGVAAGMLLTLAVYLMMHDRLRPRWQRTIPVICIAAAIAASVSRSGVIAATIALGLLIIGLPSTRRLKGLAAIPVALAVIFVGSRGLIGTFRNFFLAGTGDPSISHRTNNYPYVEQMVSHAPWLGQGGGTFIPITTQSSLHVLDNQYLSTAINLGLLGVAALIFYLIWPTVVAFAARSRTADPELRDLCMALAGAELAAAVCAATFDGLSFPMFFNLQALVAGLIGAVWIIVQSNSGNMKAHQIGGS